MHFYKGLQWILDLSVQSAKPPLGLQGAKWSDRFTLSPHCPGPHWSPKADLCTPPPSALALPLNFALRCLVGCRTRLCCVSGGNASPLSTEQLFDDGPCCTSLWFQSLQRAGLHMGLACSHNGPKSQGSGLHGPYTLAYRQLSNDLFCIKIHAES